MNLRALIFTFVAIVLMAAMTPRVRAWEVKGNTIILTRQEMQWCVSEGGCRLITEKKMAQEKEKAVQACRNSV